jgi:glycosyltransferase involved in cell wall biosynthesis
MAAVSIVIPTYNRPHLLRLALNGVRAQSFGDIELVVQDDASPADVAAVIAEFPDLAIRYYRNERGVGQNANIRMAIGRATGKYLALLADDDVWKPGFLRRMVEAMEAEPNCVLAFSNYEVIDGNGVVQSITDKLRRYHGNHLLARGYHGRFEHIATVFRAVTVISGSLLRRDAADWTQIPPGLSVGIDTYLGFLAARLGGLCYVDPEPLVQIRFHTGTVTAASWTDPTQIRRKHESFVVLWEHFLRDPAMRHRRYYEMKRWWYRWALVIDQLRLGDWRDALKRASALRCYDPRMPIYFIGFLIRLKLIGLDRRFLP